MLLLYLWRKSIEMSEMIATANTKSIEEIKSFLSRQKEVYKIPYETHPEGQATLMRVRRDFMPEDTKAGMIQAYLDRYTCSKQLFREPLNHPFDEPKQWEIREVNDIMNHCVTGWRYFSNPRIFEGYGRQKGWERETKATDTGNGAEKIPKGFVEVTEQMELPF